MLLSLTILGILNSGDTVAYASGMAGYYIDTDQTFEKVRLLGMANEN